MSEKLFDLSIFKDTRPAEELDQLEQMKRFLLKRRDELKDGEQTLVTWPDFLQYCKDHEEQTLIQSEQDFVWAVRFWFGVADILSAQGKIKAKRIW